MFSVFELHIELEFAGENALERRDSKKIHKSIDVPITFEGIFGDDDTMSAHFKVQTKRDNRGSTRFD